MWSKVSCLRKQHSNEETNLASNQRPSDPPTVRSKVRRANHHTTAPPQSDEAFSKIAMVMPTSHAETGNSNLYAALQPVPGPALQDECKEYACAALVEDQQSVGVREDYLEPLDEREAAGKESISTNREKTGKH